jgi:type I restriction enzyme M protein
MFVQSARFIDEHQNGAQTDGEGSPAERGTISIYGQERVNQTIRLCQMNLAVHGLAGDVRQANSYYEDPHNAVGKFDFVMANPPFNVNNVDKEKLKGDRRFPFGLPKPDNGNYLWIQLFYSALGSKGRAGFVMANSAADARHSEQAIRQQLIESGAVDVMVSIGSNFFYTVTLPCTLWFMDRGKAESERRDKVLFLDARRIFRQVSRAHRDFTPAQIEFLSNIVRLYRGEEPEFRHAGENTGGVELPEWGELFPEGVYQDVPGLCKVTTLEEIEGQGWSLNPGRYVGVAAKEPDDFDFLDRVQEMNEELELLNQDANLLEETIAQNIATLIEELS